MEKMRSAFLEKKKSRKNIIICVIAIFFCVLFASIEALVLSQILETKVGETIEVFAPQEVITQRDMLYQSASLLIDTVPVAEFVMGNIVDPNKPMIALTFDDGPHPVNTLRVLDILKKYHARATFFMVGQNVQANKQIPKMVIEQGCEIGTHTWSHSNLNVLNKEEIINEISSGASIIEQNTGKKVKLLRPPYGNANESVKSIAKKQGKVLILWNIDTEDWKSRNADKVYESVINNVSDGDIVLMHDIYETTADATERIVKDLTSKGYQLVTVTELFRAKGKSLNYGEKYYNCKW